LRPDGATRLRAHYHAINLAFPGPRPGLIPLNPIRRGYPPPLNSERGSDIRAVESRRRMGAFREAVPGYLAVMEFISNISKA